MVYRFFHGITLLGLMAAVALPSPSYAQSAQSTVIELAPGFSPDPLSVEGISGGREPMATVANTPSTPTGPCIGFVDDQPDHQLTLSATFDYLALEVESQQDTVLLIQGPGGVWCNDDSVGHNPRIAGEWLPGDYRVWIGSYAQGHYYPYTLRIIENAN